MVFGLIDFGKISAKLLKNVLIFFKLVKDMDHIFKVGDQGT